MKFQTRLNNNIIAILGTWDPLLPRHRALFKNLLRHSRKKGLNPYVIIAYPNPANYIGENFFKDYCDLNTRIELLKYSGINNILTLDMAREDVTLGSADVLDTLFRDTGITLSELWIGENQMFGRGEEGILTMRTECAKRNIKFKVLKNSFLVSLDKDSFYRDFREGNFALTAAVAGCFPTYKLNEQCAVNMYDGAYNAVLRERPFDKNDEIKTTVKIADGKVKGLTAVGEYCWLVLKEKVR